MRRGDIFARVSLIQVTYTQHSSLIYIDSEQALLILFNIIY